MSRDQLDRGLSLAVAGVVLMIAVLGPLATGAVRPVDFAWIQGLAALAGLLWLARWWLGTADRLFWPPICWAVLAFVIYAIIRCQRADVQYVAREELQRVIVYALVFFVVVNNLHRQETITLVASVLVFLAMAISMYAIYQCATGSDRVWGFIRPPQYAGRGSGTYICPNHLAGFLELTLPLALALTVMGRVGILHRILLGYACLVILAGLGVTFSRGGWVAAAASIPLLFAAILTKKSFRVPALAALLVVLLAGVAFYVGTDRAKQRFDRILKVDSQSSVLFRLNLWGPAVRMWRESPWWGVGPGHYDYRFPAFRPPEVQARPGHAHNDYLNALADWGLIGLGLMSAIWGLLFAGAWKTWRYVRRENDLGGKPSSRAGFVVGASAGLVALLVHALFDFNFYIPANAMTAVILMGMLSAQLRFTTDRYWTGRGLLWKLLTTIAVAGAVGVVGLNGWRQGAEAHWLRQSRRPALDAQAQLACLEKAWALDPLNPETAYRLGETLRLISWEGNPDYADWAQRAIPWFERARQLNPYDPNYALRIGMCLDWLGRHAEAAPYFQQAVSLDPNNYYVHALTGWHHLSAEEYPAAKASLERSIELHHAWKNPIARSYLEIVNRKLAETPAQPQPVKP